MFLGGVWTQLHQASPASRCVQCLPTVARLCCLQGDCDNVSVLLPDLSLPRVCGRMGDPFPSRYAQQLYLVTNRIQLGVWTSRCWTCDRNHYACGSCQQYITLGPTCPTLKRSPPNLYRWSYRNQTSGITWQRLHWWWRPQS